MRHELWPIVLVLPWLQVAGKEDPADAVLQRLREHYSAVQRELCARDVSGLTPEQHAARERMIATLEAYRVRGDFTRNTDFPGARVPYFVDHEGRLCAVANLLHATGEDQLVREVARANNHIWVSELAADERFATWLERVGLSFDEAVRIQGPHGGGPRPPPTPSAPSPRAPENWGGPIDTGGGSPGGPASGPVTRPGASGGPTGAPGPALAPGTGLGPTSPTTPGAGFDNSADDWMQWWEFNKLRWLEPSLRNRVLPGDDRTSSESESARLRRLVAPRILAELAHPQADVRAAAAFAYARAAGAAGVPELVKLLADKSSDVRESAILALGTSSTEEGVHALLTLLKAKTTPTPRAKALAIVALGVARMHGKGKGTEAILARFLGELEREGGDDILHAALLFQSLSPSPELAQRVRCASGRFREDCEHAEPRAQTRGRALETLRFDTEVSTVFPRLLDAVHGRAADERRSAASALAETAFALDPLLTAFELEEEPLTRGRLLIALGERGDERARDFLAGRLEHGRKNEHPWAALSLGLFAGKNWDAHARAELRSAHARASKTMRDSILLALGLARDVDAHDLLVRALATSRTDRTRMFAAVALGLVGKPEGHAVLTSAIASVTCPYARSGMALAIALYGDPADVPTLIGLLRAERRPESLRDLALALGLKGSPGTTGSLLELLDQDPPAAVRSAALDALGLALVDAPALALTEISRASNYSAWPEWVLGLLRHPL